MPGERRTCKTRHRPNRRRGRGRRPRIPSRTLFSCPRPVRHPVRGTAFVEEASQPAPRCQPVFFAALFRPARTGKPQVGRRSRLRKTTPKKIPGLRPSSSSPAPTGTGRLLGNTVAFRQHPRRGFSPPLRRCCRAAGPNPDPPAGGRGIGDPPAPGQDLFDATNAMPAPGWSGRPFANLRPSEAVGIEARTAGPAPPISHRSCSTSLTPVGSTVS